MAEGVWQVLLIFLLSPEDYLAYVVGDIYHLSVLGKPFIVLSSAKAMMELLDKRGAIYSDRPTFEMCGELYVPNHLRSASWFTQKKILRFNIHRVGYKDCIPLHSYDQTLRESRKLMASHLAASKIALQYPFLERNVLRYFLSPLLNNPDHLLEHIHR